MNIVATILPTNNYTCQQIKNPCKKHFLGKKNFPKPTGGSETLGTAFPISKITEDTLIIK